jgi:integrase
MFANRLLIYRALTMAANTSITKTQLLKHLQEAPNRSELACSSITGFHLSKGKLGGTWRIRYTDIDGKRRLFKIGTVKTKGKSYEGMLLDTAVDNALEIRSQIQRGLDPHTIKKETEQKTREAKLKLEAITNIKLRDYLEGPYTVAQNRKRGKGQHTLNIIRSNFKHLLDRHMDHITSGDIQAWQQKREQEGISAPTIQRAYGALRTLLKHAVEAEVISALPFKPTALEKPSADEVDRSLLKKKADEIKSRRMLTDEEKAQLWHGLDLYEEEKRAKRRSSRAHGKAHLADLDAVKYADWFHPFMITAFYTGARCGDLYELRWSDISFPDVGAARIRFTPLKTRHHDDPSTVDCLLADDLRQTLQDWLKQCPKSKGDYVFPSDTGTKRDRQSHKKIWAKVKSLGGITSEIDFYCFRHNFISTLIDQNISLKAIAELTGHKKTSTIEEHYSHVMPARKDEAIQAFSRTVTKTTTKENRTNNHA